MINYVKMLKTYSQLLKFRIHSSSPLFTLMLEIFARICSTQWTFAKMSHAHNYVSRIDRNFSRVNRTVFYNCVNIKTCFQAKI